MCINQWINRWIPQLWRVEYKYVSESVHKKTRVTIILVTHAHIDTPGSADEAIFALRACHSWQLTGGWLNESR